MKEVITHMPMSPRSNPELGYYGIHTQAHIISNLEGTSYFLTGNELGNKRKREIESLEMVLNDLEKLGIHPSGIWRDSDESNISFIQKLVSAGVNNGLVTMENREIFLCPCGKTEFLNLPENLCSGSRKKTYEIEGGGIRCKVCGQQASLERVKCLIFKLPQAEFPYIKIYPSYAQEELKKHFNFFSGKDYLLSRSTSRPIAIQVDNDRFWLDVDFGWIPFIYHLQQESRLKVEVLLTGHKTLKQVALSLLVAKILGGYLPSRIIVTPYINIDFGKRPHLKAKEFLSQNEGVVARFFLAQTLGADRKEIWLASSDVYLIAKALENLRGLNRPTGERPSLEHFLNRGNSCRIRGISKKLRGGKYDQLENIEQWLLWAIIYQG